MATKLVLKQPSALKLRFQPGATGPAGKIVSVEAETLPPGSDATVVNNGTPEAAAFVFGIPEGPKGDKGDQGDQGEKGDKGDKGDPGTATIVDGDKGDITTSDDGDTWAIDADAVDNTKLVNMASGTIKGRATAGTGDPEDLTGEQATAILDAFTGDAGSGGVKGLVPAPAAGDAAKVLTGNGSWTALTGYKYRQTTTFTSSGTWTKQPWCKAIRVTVVGGGGSGGSPQASTSQMAISGGGAYGGISIKFVPAASLGSTESVTVGNGGSGPSAPSAGNSGGSSSFGSHCSATGGAGGGCDSGGGTTSPGQQLGGAGGIGSGGDINIAGAPGGTGVRFSGAIGNGGIGGSGPYGGGGTGVNQGNSGIAGRGYGAGGGGGADNSSAGRLGGAGTAGIVIVEEFE